MHLTTSGLIPLPFSEPASLILTVKLGQRKRFSLFLITSSHTLFNTSSTSHFKSYLYIVRMQ